MSAPSSSTAWSVKSWPQPRMPCSTPSMQHTYIAAQAASQPAVLWTNAAPSRSASRDSKLGPDLDPYFLNPNSLCGQEGMVGEQPKPTYRKDYKPTPFLVPKLDLTFQLGEESTRVLSTLHIRPNPASPSNGAPELALDGAFILSCLAKSALDRKVCWRQGRGSTRSEQQSVCGSMSIQAMELPMCSPGVGAVRKEAVQLRTARRGSVHPGQPCRCPCSSVEDAVKCLAGCTAPPTLPPPATALRPEAQDSCGNRSTAKLVRGAARQGTQAGAAQRGAATAPEGWRL